MYSIVETLRVIKGVETKVKMLFGTGNLTNDAPEIREVTGGKKVLRGDKDHRFSIAFDNGKNEDGSRKTLFYPINAWEQTATNLAKLGTKGRTVEVAGRIETQNYTGNDGQPRTQEILVIERFEVKGPRPGNSNNAGGTNTSSNPAGGGASTNNAEGGNQGAFDDGKPIDISEDDIPF